jgi:hypothetical protein
MRFNSTTNIPTAEQRHAALVARILVEVVQGPKTPYELRKAVQEDPDFKEWAGAKLIWDTIVRLYQLKRLIVVFKQERSMPAYTLPQDPFAPFSCPKPTPEEQAIRERKILGSLNWSKWFHIPSKIEQAVRIPDVDYIVRT